MDWVFMGVEPLYVWVEAFVYWLKINLMNFVYGFGLFFVLLLVVMVFRRFVIGKLLTLAKKTKYAFDDELLRIIQGLPGYFYFIIALYFPLKLFLNFPGFAKVIDAVFIIVVVYQAIRSLQAVVEFLIKRFVSKNGGGEHHDVAFGGLTLVSKILLWSTGILLVLSNLGIDITSLVASLGIGGIAVALAVQNVLGDIFSSFSIYFDKPFKVGDSIKVGEEQGKVKKIGLKTTRIVTLQGEELVISNKELTGSMVHNFKQMEKWRDRVVLKVVYSTGLEKLKEIKEIVENIINENGNAELLRVHFFEFGDFSLNFEVVYYSLSKEYGDLMRTRESILFEIRERFDEKGIEMAFPTQTVYLQK